MAAAAPPDEYEDACGMRWWLLLLLVVAAFSDIPWAIKSESESVSGRIAFKIPPVLIRGGGGLFSATNTAAEDGGIIEA